MKKTKKKRRKVKIILLLIMIGAGVWYDLHSYRIPNEVILIGFGAGLIYRCWEGDVAKGAIGLLLPILLLYPLFYIHALGAGDIKLFAVIGMFLGYPDIFYFIISAFFFGAGLSVIQIVRYGNLKSRMYYFICYISNYLRTKKVEAYYMEDRDGRQPVIHFSLAILLAAFTQIVLSGKVFIN